MSGRMIITISRQFGSGGRNIGERIAKKRGIPFYDNELIIEGAKESGVDPEMVKSLEETPTKAMLYALSGGGGGSFFGGFSPVIDMPITDKLFVAQSEVIRRFATEAEKGCVIVGRAADYVLRDDPDTLNIFIHRDFDERVNQVAKRYDLTRKKAHDRVKKIDKQRAGYYSYYADKHWGQVDNYDLCLNSGILGEDGCVAVIDATIDNMLLRRKARRKNG